MQLVEVPQLVTPCTILCYVASNVSDLSKSLTCAFCGVDLQERSQPISASAVCQLGLFTA